MLDQLTIRDFRSIRKLEIPVKSLNVLVGPNGSGKSSILGALEILAEYTRQGSQFLANAGPLLSTKGVRGLPDHRALSMALEGTVQVPNGRPRRYSYLCELGSARGAWTRVIREEFTLKDTNPPSILMEYPAKNGGGMTQFYGEDGMATMGLGAGGQSPLGIVAQQDDGQGNQTIQHFGRELLAWQLLSASPQYAKVAQPAKRETRLSSTGENISAVLHSIYAEDYDSFSRIVEAVKAAVPGIKSISVPVTSEGETYVQVTEAGSRIPIPIWALSDGTIALMELFTVLEMDSRPPLIMIEEPENFVHPGIMENLAESFERATETAQILVTTHSPFLLNRLSPENVIVVEKIDGETKIHQALDREGVREAANRLGLGDLWISGGIGGTP